MNQIDRQAIPFSRTLLHTALALAVAGVAVPAVAQDEQQVRSIEEVFVSARRKLESQQDIPIAVSAMSEAQLEERGVKTEADLQMSAPGLMVRATNSSNQLAYSLRGQSIDAFSYSAPAVLAYVNEVQAGGVSASSFFDLASVQVLKGPQGTLFGRNVTGGAVLYETKRPEHDFGGYAKAGVGSFSEKSFEGAANLPITEEFALRVAGLKRERDGWQKNLFLNKDQASIDTENVRVSLLFENDTVENLLVAYYAEHGGNSEGLKMRNAYTNGQTNNGVPLGSLGTDLYGPGLPLVDPAKNPGVFQLGFNGTLDFLEKQKSADFHDTYNDVLTKSEIRQKLVTNTTSVELNDDLVVKNIIGYNNVESYQATDIDGSPFLMLAPGNPGTTEGYIYGTEQISDELQLSGSSLDGDLEFIVGLFVSKEKNRNRIPLGFAADHFTPLGIFAYDFETEDESKAIFAQGTYAITDAWNVTVGARNTWEKVSLEHIGDDIYKSMGIGGGETEVDRPSWNLSTDYHINDENLVYLSNRGSWRTGGFNGTSINVTPTGAVPDDFDPEKTWDIEAGYKYTGHLGDIPFLINVAVYEQTIEDVQRTVYINVTSISGNVGEAKVSGVELETRLNPTEWLEIGAAYAYTDARYTDARGNVAGFDLEFGPYGDAPENSLSIYFVTTNEIAGIGTLSFRGDYYNVDDTYFSNLNDTIAPGTELEGYELVNFRLALDNIADSGFSIAAYVRNATDEEYERGGLPLGGVLGTNATIAGEPRTTGAEVSFKF